MSTLAQPESASTHNCQCLEVSHPALKGWALVDRNEPRPARASHFDVHPEIQGVVLEKLVSCQPLARVELPVAPPTTAPLAVDHPAVVIIVLQRVHLNQLGPVILIPLLVEEGHSELGPQGPNQVPIPFSPHEVQVHGEEHRSIAVAAPIRGDVEAELVTPGMGVEGGAEPPPAVPAEVPHLEHDGCHLHRHPHHPHHQVHVVVRALPPVARQFLPDGRPGAAHLCARAGDRLPGTLEPVGGHVLPLRVEPAPLVRAVHLEVWALLHVTSRHVPVLAHLPAVRAGVVPEGAGLQQVDGQSASEEGLAAPTGALDLSVLASELVVLQLVQVPRPLAGVVPVGAHDLEGLDPPPAGAIQERLERLAAGRAPTRDGAEGREAQGAVDLPALARRLLGVACGEEAYGTYEVVRYFAHKIALVATTKILQIVQ